MTYAKFLNLSNHSKCRGFTLVEALVVVAIIGILAGIAWPFYNREVYTNQRKEAVSALMMLRHAMEQCNSDYGDYQNCMITNNPVANSPSGPYIYSKVPNPANCGAAISVNRNNQVDNLFSLSCSFTQNGYILTANNNNPKDTECTTLTLDNLGRKGYTPVNPAWDYHRCWGD